MTREEAINKAINIVVYFEAHFAKSKEAREEAINIIEALEQEPCDDCISRQAVLDCLTATKLKKFDFVLHAREEIKKLPPVTSQQNIVNNGTMNITL